MNVAVVQFDTREDSQHSELVSQNMQYARHAGYSHDFVTHAEPGLPPYWGKVLACLGLAERGECEAILFLDTDAVVMDFDFRVESLLADGTAFAASGSRAGSVNAGIFAVHCRHGIELLNEWMDMYDPSRWHYRDGRWRCDGEWAGEDYKQGALNRLLPKYESVVKQVGWRTFMHCDHHRIDGDALCVRDFQAFVAAMRESAVVHFCRAYSSLIPHRWTAREGRLVLFDERSPNPEEEMKRATELCRDVPP